MSVPAFGPTGAWSTRPRPGGGSIPDPQWVGAPEPEPEPVRQYVLCRICCRQGDFSPKPYVVIIDGNSWCLEHLKTPRTT